MAQVLDANLAAEAYIRLGAAHATGFVGLRLISIGIPWGRIAIPAREGGQADIEAVER